MDEKQRNAFAARPVPETCRLLDFDHADIVTQERFPPKYVLRVSGIAPYRNMDVRLVPRVYVRQPEYWGIEVVGCLPGVGLPALAPYTASLPLDGSIGTEGVEVIGATRTVRLAVPPADDPAQVPLDADLFTLSGGGLEVTYRPFSRRWQGPYVEVKHGAGKESLTFTRERIETLTSRIGQVVTVVLEALPDAPVLTLTLVVPTVRLIGTQEEAIETLGLLTTDRTSALVGRPVSGAAQTYRSVALRGRAVVTGE